MSTTNQRNNTLMTKMMEVLIAEGVDGFRPIMEWLLNVCMKLERSNLLNAEPYQRDVDRIGHANGFKPKHLRTRLGELELEIPQVRGLGFYPKCLEKGSRSEVALKVAIAEMYVQGVSTRRVRHITEQLCGLEINSSQVSRISKEMDSGLQEFRNRALGEYPIVILDARYEKVRHGGGVRDCAALVAIGINRQGYREILGISISLSEAEVHWRHFLEDLQSRGLKGIRLIISDDHSGLKAARMAVFPSVPWQRCQYHMAQNAQGYVPKRSMREEIAQVMRDIFNARNIQEARQQVKEAVKIYADKAPEFAKWLEENIEEGLTVFQFPEPIRKKIRTSNMLEAVNKQIKRRTRVAGLFPNTASCLRLVSAVLQEIHEDWACSKKYINLEGIF